LFAAVPEWDIWPAIADVVIETVTGKVLPDVGVVFE
jgi:hypothetical protein